MDLWIAMLNQSLMNWDVYKTQFGANSSTLTCYKGLR
jgi:hypothetical protein